ncbi:MAG: hypothetical protein LBH85_05710 [Treponema sp.]|jgi:hypothetical protein|nr:hypothetical protein [Treponema sp.]
MGKPIWDSRGSFFEVPSLRNVGELAATAVTSVATFGAGGAVSAILIAGLDAVAISMVDDIAFGFLDVAAGYKSVTETMVDLGKKLLYPWQARQSAPHSMRQTGLPL